PTDQQVNIFVPFFTTKQKGTGLGLAICQRIMKNHGGSISVQSRVNEGTTFVMRLPSLAAEQPAIVETPAPEGTPYPGTIQPPVALPEPKEPVVVEGKKKKEKKRRAG
ncbi:MAG: ATP-binding protein, partial [Myxococcaceae bacterium]